MYGESAADRLFVNPLKRLKCIRLNNIKMGFRWRFCEICVLNGVASGHGPSTPYL
jgi:hypothetical protein